MEAAYRAATNRGPPSAVLSFNQIDLPAAGHSFHGFFALDSSLHVARIPGTRELRTLYLRVKLTLFAGAVLFHSDDDALVTPV
jgi:hypothetical protein